jgi:hypothetical protein
VAPNTDHHNEETEPPTQDQTLLEQRIVTFEGTTEQDTHNLRSTSKRKAATSHQQERVEEPSPTLAEILTQLKNLEKAKSKISAQVVAKQKATQEAKQLADANRKLEEMQAELEELRKSQEEEYDSAWDNEQGEAIPSNNQTTNHHTHHSEGAHNTEDHNLRQEGHQHTGANSKEAFTNHHHLPRHSIPVHPCQRHCIKHRGHRATSPSSSQSTMAP